MKKKGFTLVEIIMVIAILGLLSIVIANSLTESLKNQKEKDFDNYIDKIEAAACAFIEIRPETREQETSFNCSIIPKPDRCKSKTDCMSSGCEIKVSDIITLGLIDGRLKNPKTDELLSYYNNKIIKIYWNANKEKVCQATATDFN